MRNRLMQLLAENRQAGRVAESKIVAAAKEGEEAVIYLYDPIVSDRMTAEYFGCVCAQDLVPQIDAIKADTIRVRINCPGGDVFGMQAIMNSLRNQSAKLIAQIDGVAASAATGISSVCDEVVMEPGALFMIHNCHGLGYGDKADMLALAATMEKVDSGMNDAYVAKTGKTAEQVTAWMNAETWFTADEAVEAGFADSVNSSGRNVQAAAKWNLSAFANAPAAATPPGVPAIPAPPIPPPANDPVYASQEHRDRQQQRLGMLARLSLQ